MQHKNLSIKITLLTIVVAVVTGMFTACTKTQTANACMKKQAEDACSELYNNCYLDGKWILTQWGGHRWHVLPQDEQTQAYRDEFMLMNGEDSSLPEILELLTTCYGKPFAYNETSPQLLSEKFSDPSIFAMPNNRQLEGTEQLFWWDTDRYIIRLYEAHGHPEVGLPACAVIALYDKDIIKNDKSN